MGGQTQAIQSRHNEQVKKLRQALTRGQRTSEGLLAIDTFHLIEEALASSLAVVQAFCTLEAEEQLRRLLARYQASPQIILLAARVFESLSPSPALQGAAVLVRPRSWTAPELFRPGPALVVLLAGVQDPGNAGTILRSAEAFGATGALMLEGTVHPENPKLLRASAGSVFRFPHLHGLKYGAALEMLRQQRTRLYAAVPRARRTLDDIELSEPLALAIGSEGGGVPDAILAASEHVSIPHARRVESLNAAVAAGVFLYEAAKARRKTGRRPET